MFTFQGISDITPASVYCIGRNYAEHARELNNPVPGDPVIFMKPVTSLLQNGGTVILPDGSSEVHHEAELVVLIGARGKNIKEANAFNHIAGYAAGVDITDRAKQSELKAKSLPWLAAKGLDTFAPLGNIIPVLELTHPDNIDVTMLVNGEIRQSGNTSDMLFPIPVLISRLSALFTLQPGDLIFTGTPAGVGPLRKGDKAEARIAGGKSIVHFEVA